MTINRIAIVDGEALFIFIFDMLFGFLGLLGCRPRSKVAEKQLVHPSKKVDVFRIVYKESIVHDSLNQNPTVDGEALFICMFDTSLIPCLKRLTMGLESC